MDLSNRRIGRTLLASVRAMLVLTVLLGIVYTGVVTGIGYLIFNRQATGSLLRSSSGQVIGSSLLGQNFTDASGNPLPKYFQARPSAAGSKGYDPTSSGGTNLGPNSQTLTDAITKAKQSIASFDGVAESQVPADAVTSSASGLDPDISPAYAAIQVNRVASARGLSADQVRSLVAAHTQGRFLGFLGDPVVDVVELNHALDETH